MTNNTTISPLEAIKWELGIVLSRDPEEREAVYSATGIGTDGKTYSATVTTSCGEIVKVEDIEEYTFEDEAPDTEHYQEEKAEWVTNEH